MGINFCQHSWGHQGYHLDNLYINLRIYTKDKARHMVNILMSYFQDNNTEGIDPSKCQIFITDLIRISKDCYFISILCILINLHIFNKDIYRINIFLLFIQLYFFRKSLLNIDWGIYDWLDQDSSWLHMKCIYFCFIHMNNKGMNRPNNLDIIDFISNLKYNSVDGLMHNWHYNLGNNHTNIYNADITKHIFNIICFICFQNSLKDILNNIEIRKDSNLTCIMNNFTMMYILSIIKGSLYISCHLKII